MQGIEELRALLNQKSPSSGLTVHNTESKELRCLQTPMEEALSTSTESPSQENYRDNKIHPLNELICRVKLWIWTSGHGQNISRKLDAIK